MKYTKKQINNLLDNLRPAKTGENKSGYALVGHSCNHICRSAPWEDSSFCSGC